MGGLDLRAVKPALVAVTAKANTKTVGLVGLGTGIATALTAAILALAKLLGDWHFDNALGHAVKTGCLHIEHPLCEDPQSTVAQVAAGVLAIVVLTIGSLLVAWVGMPALLKRGSDPGAAQ